VKERCPSLFKSNRYKQSLAPEKWSSLFQGSLAFLKKSSIPALDQEKSLILQADCLKGHTGNILSHLI